MENEEEKKDSVETEVLESPEEVMQEVDSPAVGETVAEELHEVVEDSTETTEEKTEEKVEDIGKKKSKGPIILLILLVLLIGIGCSYYLLVINKSDENESKKIENKPKEVHSGYRMSGNSLEEFDLYFLKLENEEKNKVYSPLSIKYALEMLAEGASGETKEQLDAVIGDYVAKSYPNSEHMSFANAMFIQNNFKDSIKSDYTSNLTKKYNAEVIYDEFSTPDNINNWVSDKTLHLVNNLVNDDIKDNVFFLINALAIDMNWNNQVHCANGHDLPCTIGTAYNVFYRHEKLDDNSEGPYHVIDYSYTSEDDFYGGYSRKNEFNGRENAKGAEVLADFNKYDIINDLGEDKIREILTPEYEEWLKTEYGKTDLPLEQGLDKFINELKENYGKAANSTDFLVHEDDNVKTFAKDLQTYDGITLQYVGIMPKKIGLSEFVKNTNKDELNSIIKSLKEVKIDSFEEGYVTRIRGFIPFFKFEYELQLMEDLKELGIKDVFHSSTADLSGLTTSPNIYIDKAIHKANIEFSNEGIKASAATAFGGAGATSGPYFEHLFKVPVKEIDVTFDKPYMYLIRDKESGEVWFAGTVYEPIYK